MRLAKHECSLVLTLCLCLLSPAFAQNAGGDNVDARIKRQHARIKKCQETGTIKQDQAAQLKSGLDDLAAKVNAQRQANGGNLKPEQLKQAENALNQSNEQIKSFEGAGTSVDQGANVLGPKWTPGKDGAQNSKTLKKQMKVEEKRELRQEKQANEQTLEQQQLDYEKGMMTKLQSQRKNILKQKQDLQQERKDTGAN